MLPNQLIEPDPEWAFTTCDQRAALLRQGVVVLADGVERRKRWMTIAGPDRLAATRLAQERLGPRVDVTYLGDVPRRLEPLPCLGYCESEPKRLKLRYATTRAQHVDEILHEEDDFQVVVFATVCTPLHDREIHRCDAPHHIYLEAELNDREVIDGVTGLEVPYRNVMAELAARESFLSGGSGLRAVGDEAPFPYDGA